MSTKFSQEQSYRYEGTFSGKYVTLRGRIWHDLNNILVTKFYTLTTTPGMFDRGSMYEDVQEKAIGPHKLNHENNYNDNPDKPDKHNHPCLLQSSRQQQEQQIQPKQRQQAKIARTQRRVTSMRVSQFQEVGTPLLTPTFCRLLSAVSCLLSAVCCLLSAVRCLLSAVCCPLSAVRCLLSAVCCLNFAVSCLVSCLVPGVSCLLSAVWC
jgi:hypothetical protein